MTRLVPTLDAARRLGVEPATLYAYVSRGLLNRQRAVDGRTSLFAIDELEALAQRGRRRAPAEPPSVDVQIATAVTQLGEGDVRYRGHPVPVLAATASFEQVAELLWVGALPADPVAWPAPPAALVDAARSAAAALGPAADSALRMAAMTTVLASHDPLRGDRSPEAVAALGRRLLATVVRAGHPANRKAGRHIADHLAARWTRDPSPLLIAALDRALVLLADHELASSTLGVRVAASTWADPYAAVLSGLGVLSGPLHGSASNQVSGMFVRCEVDGPALVLGEYLREGIHVPGFGHKVYRGEDPRVAPLMESVDGLGDGTTRLAIVHEFLHLANARLTRRPNVDLALGAMAFVSATPVDVTELFAVARVAGWLAHAMEEYGEKPVRFRASGRYTGPASPDEPRSTGVPAATSPVASRS